MRILSGLSARNHRGFTLVELLVVIVIVAILVSLLLPVMSRVKINAGSTTSVSNLKQIGTACFAYAADNNGNLPDVSDQGYTATRFNAWPPLLTGKYLTPKVFTTSLSTLKSHPETTYMAVDDNGNMNMSDHFQPSVTTYPVTFESWEFSDYGDLTTEWGTRGHQQKLAGNVPLGAIHQKLAWSYEWDVPQTHGFGQILYFDGHVNQTPTTTYAAWNNYMRSKQ